MTEPLLVIGGDADYNLGSLIARMVERGCPHRAVSVGAEGNPSVVWDLQADLLAIDGEEVRAPGAFVRYDVFTHLADPRPATAQRASAWHATLTGWLFAHPEVRLLNRGANAPVNKPYHLHLAHRAAGACAGRSRSALATGQIVDHEIRIVSSFRALRRAQERLASPSAFFSTTSRKKMDSGSSPG